MNKTLTTVQQVIEALGGVKQAAHWAGVGESAICNWVSRGFIPAGWHFRLHQTLAPQGYELTVNVFRPDVLVASKVSRYLEKSL